MGKLNEVFPDKVRKESGAKESKDELEEELKRLDKELVQRARRARLKEYVIESELNVAKKERELEKLKRGSEEEVLSGASPIVAAELAKLPEEQRKAVIETYAMLKAAEKTKPEQAGMSILLPLLVGFAKANPQASQPDLVKFAEVMNKQLETGMKLAESKKEKKAEAAYDPVALIKTFGEIIRENVQKPMEELVQRVQPAPSPFEKILMDDKLFERAKALGMFGGAVHQQPQSMTPELKRLDMEIEKIKQDTQLKLKEMELQQQRWMAQQQIELRKWEQIGKLFEGPIGRTIQTLGAGAARKLSGMAGQASVTQVTCPRCNKQFPVFADAEKAICPYCGAILAKTGGEEAEETGQAKEEETKPKQKSKRK